MSAGCAADTQGEPADEDAADDDAADDDVGDDDAGDDDTGDDDDVHPPADVEGTVWSPTLEWSFGNPTWEGNPFDLIASVTFTHDASQQAITTQMFYAGEDAWNARFTGTRTGMWSWLSTSDDPELDGLTGTIWMDPNPGQNGFVSTQGDKWIWTGTEEAFVPQLAMVAAPDYYYGDWETVDDWIDTFFGEHGFNGFHIPVMCRWADLDQTRCDQVGDVNPDGRTFEALEILIRKAHAAGGCVHLWAWGDAAHHTTPSEWGINGTDDLRIQRYIAARLGPLPGWTLGYGYDLDEWTTEAGLQGWHDSLQGLLGWPHLLGGRSAGPNSGLDHSGEQIWEGFDYSGYEHHEPDYDVYVAAIEARPDKPTFSEDRFRVRDHHDKDYDETQTRRGLYHSTMAGGVANIWGYLLEDGEGVDYEAGLSGSYPHPEWIKTSAEFFAGRFTADVERCNGLTDGVCLMIPGGAHYLFYKEDSASVSMDLTGMVSDQPAVAVDALLPYAEIDIGPLQPSEQLWSAPYASDWAIAVGAY